LIRRPFLGALQKVRQGSEAGAVYRALMTESGPQGVPDFGLRVGHEFLQQPRDVGGVTLGVPEGGPVGH